MSCLFKICPDAHATFYENVNAVSMWQILFEYMVQDV